VSRRTVVSGPRKLALIARAGAAAALPSRPPLQEGTAALPAVQFLVDAAAAAVPAEVPVPRRPPAVPQRTFDERVVWIIDLFERQAAGRALR
jgi:hypothetical protein